MTQVVRAESDQQDEVAAAQAAEAAFAAVDDDGKKPAETVKVEPEVDPKVAEEAAVKAAADAEWEGVPAKVRQTLEVISGKVGQIDRLQHDLKSVAGRTGAALEGVHALKTALDAAKAATKAGDDAPTQEQIAAAATSSEKWNQAKEDYPEWAEAMDERLAAMGPGKAAVDVAGLKTELTGSMSEIVAQATSQAKAEARELAKVDRKHENWEATVETPDFMAWKPTQPPEIQALFDSDRAADAIKMLDLYEDHRKAVAEATAKTDRNKQRLESAVTPKGVSVASPRTVSDREAAERAFAAVDNE